MYEVEKNVILVMELLEGQSLSADLFQNNRTEEVTHVFVRRGKTTPLGPCFDGPFEIKQRLGTSCVQIRVGSYANGEPRYETQHWNNVKPAVLSENAVATERIALGRRPLNPEAKSFKPKN